jgi:2,4-dienoyl-CoA reductase-like NADH-dependent reductase (Old Yellow Enzyme family)
MRSLGLELPCDEQVLSAPDSPLAQPIEIDGRTIGNRWAIHPMEGWDGTRDGRPGENTLRRWRHFGASGAKLIWGGEAFAVRHDGRANPHQLFLNPHSGEDLSKLREALLDEHQRTTGKTDDLLAGLQLTHSGRYSVPNEWGQREPKIVYRHPILDRRLKLPADFPLMSDDEIRRLIETFVEAAKLAADVGFDFVDIKHCHGYLGHEFLSAHTRDGAYGGSFENRTRFLREIVAGIRAERPKLMIGVRLSAFDLAPFRPDPALSSPGKLGPGVPEPLEDCLPYRWGFGVNPNNPLEPDLTEPARFISLLRALNIRLVNLTAGSPYYNPHVQRPALYPPSDGYQPPEDPLVGVARQMSAARALKQQFPDMLFVGTAYTYLQDFLPNVAQAAVREGWIDSVGIGRMLLSYPQLPLDVLRGNPVQTKRVCRTFSDCTTAPRNALASGCYPLDPHYKQSPEAARLKLAKKP